MFIRIAVRRVSSTGATRILYGSASSGRRLRLLRMVASALSFFHAARQKALPACGRRAAGHVCSALHDHRFVPVRPLNRALREADPGDVGQRGTAGQSPKLLAVPQVSEASADGHRATHAAMMHGPNSAPPCNTRSEPRVPHRPEKCTTVLIDIDKNSSFVMFYKYAKDAARPHSAPT
jgi:hypothetical protein